MLAATTTPPPCALYSWPAVFWQANQPRRMRWVHRGTCVVGRGRCPGLATGHTLWSGAAGDAGFAWDWVEIADGVVAMADPMGVVSNVRLLDGDGLVLPATAAALHFNLFLRRLPWQDEVRRLLRTA